MTTHTHPTTHTRKEHTMTTRRRRTSPLTIKYYIQALQDRPGEWLKLPTEQTDYSTVASDINTGRRENFPPNQYEAKARADGAYVRYTGPDTREPALLDRDTVMGEQQQPSTEDLAKEINALRHENTQLRNAITTLTQAVNRLSDHFEN